MRVTGKITDWNDERGFGFVTPNGGGERAFVHISEFRRGARRPVDGDPITYQPGKDSQGRLQARKIRHADEKAQRKLPRAFLGIGSLAAAAGAASLGIIPVALAGAYFVLSGLSYFMYLFDKSAAKRGAQRTPESSLHLADLLGGWPGALIAQQQFRHKTIKQPFQFVFWLTVLLNLTAAGWLVWSGKATDVLRWFDGW